MARGVIVLEASAFIAMLLSGTPSARRHEPAAAAALLEESASFPVGRALGPLVAASAGGKSGHPETLSVPSLAVDRVGQVVRDHHSRLTVSAVSRALDGDDKEVSRVATPSRPRASRVTKEKLVADNPSLTEVTAAKKRSGAAGEKLVMPAEWAQQLQASSIAVLEGADAAKSTYYAASATLLGQPDVKVRITAGDPEAPEFLRELLVSQLLSRTGVVPTFFEHSNAAVFSPATFLLTEHIGGRRLESIIPHSAPGATGGPAVPLKQALPIMIDLLRGLTSMEHLQIVHGDLSADNVHLVSGGDGSERAVMTDFSHACLQDVADPRLRCSGEDAPPPLPAGSELRQAPETKDGEPSTVASNVWQLGLVFARMLFGGEVPTEAAILERMRPQDMAKLAETVMKSRDQAADKQEDDAWEVRAEMRNIIRRHFAIRETEGFKRLQPEYEDVLEILAGMLQKQPQHRWTAAHALEAVERVGLARGVAVPAPRPQAELPGWNEDWQ